MAQKSSEKFDYVTYGKKMRSALSNPEMILDDGLINHQYFLVKKGCYWSKKEDEALIRGLELFGVGRWKKIKFYELDKFSELELELRTCIVLGVDDLTSYHNQRLTKEEINQIRKKNGLSPF